LLEIPKVAKKLPSNLWKAFIISINKTMTKESKQTKTKTFVFVVALEMAVLNFS